jgi:cytochrome oxidase Cu insertion factor (SCO1/SenC/PrrC family)
LLLGVAVIAVAAVVALRMVGTDRPIELGPRDGWDLPPTELDRVEAGDIAPDFSLVAYSGDTITLSDFRGEKNVVLVFYRGHW